MEGKRTAQVRMLLRLGLIAFLLGVDLSAFSAFAAEPQSKSYDWAGMYLGANFGANFPLHPGERLQAISGFDSSIYDLYPATATRLGVTTGIQAGYNWQNGRWVWGLEADFNFLNGRSGPNGSFQLHQFIRVCRSSLSAQTPARTILGACAAVLAYHSIDHYFISPQVSRMEAREAPPIFHLETETIFPRAGRNRRGQNSLRESALNTLLLKAGQRGWNICISINR
jgi:hypothetical protein